MGNDVFRAELCGDAGCLRVGGVLAGSKGVLRALEGFKGALVPEVCEHALDLEFRELTVSFDKGSEVVAVRVGDYPGGDADVGVSLCVIL